MVQQDNKGFTTNKQLLRLLKLLSRRAQSGMELRREDTEYFVAYAGKSHRFPEQVIAEALRSSLAVLSNGIIKVTHAGLKDLCELTGLDCTQSLQANADVVKPADDLQSKQVLNMNESPLKRLMVRRTKKGVGYLSDAEFHAGEKLRKDFEIAQLSPRISANYSATAGSAGKGSQFQASDISDFAMDARQRINRAIDCLGPELSGVALDICCFLKGLELVERERSWPPRSAKLMLKTGLAILARHYGLAGFANHKAGQISSWGSADFKPKF